MFQQRDTWWDLLCILDLPNGVGHCYSAEERRRGDADAMSGSGGGSKGGHGAGRVTPPPPTSSRIAPGSANTSGTVSSGGTGSGKQTLISYEETSHFQVDNKFIKGVVSGIQAQFGEEWVRQQFYDYSNSILHLALDQEQEVVQNPLKLNEKQRKFVDANLARVRAIRTSSEFADIPGHPWVWCDAGHGVGNLPPACSSGAISKFENDAVSSERSTRQVLSADEGEGQMSHVSSPQSSPSVSPTLVRPPKFPSKVLKTDKMSSADGISDLEASSSPLNTDVSHSILVDSRKVIKKGSIWLTLRSYVRQLQNESGLSESDEVSIYFYNMDKFLQTEPALQALLVLLPQSKGGIAPIATGLFHKSPLVRYYSMRLLARLQQFSSTKAAFASLPGYFQTAFERQQTKDSSGSLQSEILDYSRSIKERDKNYNATVNPDNLTGDSSSTNKDIGSAETDGSMSDIFDGAGQFATLLQNSFALMSGTEQPYDLSFSETIDELDLIR
jgi:hypothetical protein